ncbi:MAG TPA: cupin domain-containing protein [Gemmataceae bacterium]|nr:cupin domain-containing protein [Gemmataceae bacterium]
MTADDVIAHLDLQPHPVEGGFFRETYRSADNLPTGRSVSTAIYYLLTPKTVSALHRLPGDEVFHFYAGDPVRMLQLWPDGSTRTLTLGTDLKAGQVPQLVVPGGVWQGSVLVDGGAWALLGATMAPGFDYADYTAGDRAALTAQYSAVAAMIERLLP